MTTEAQQQSAGEVKELLTRGFYSMAFQPIWATEDRKVFGFEALFRGPSGSPLSNTRKIFNSKGYLDRGLLLRLDLACIGSAIRTGRMLTSDYNLFINAHGETLWHLTRKDQALFRLLEQADVPPDRIILEVSESTEKAHARLLARYLRPFRKLGMKVALDDIGVRHPWLHHMLWLDPDFIKVDRAFVNHIDSSDQRQRLLYGLVQMCKHVGTGLIVEGIETEAEWISIRRLDVPFAQGYWLGYPSVADRWLEQAGSTKSKLKTPGIYHEVEAGEEVL